MKWFGAAAGVSVLVPLVIGVAAAALLDRIDGPLLDPPPPRQIATPERPPGASIPLDAPDGSRLEPAAPAPVTGPGEAPPAPTPEETVPRPTAPRPAGVARPLETYENGAVLLEQTFFSVALEREMSYQVFLPPDYDAGDRRFAAVYMLHGLDAGPSQWPDLGIGVIADRLIAEGAIEPLLIVLPFGSNSYFLDEPEGGLRWAAHVGRDVVTDVDARFRTLDRPTSRAVGGLSMGGEAALRFALTQPQTFGVAGAHSPSLRRTYAETPPGLFADEEAFERASVFRLIENSDPPPELRIWLDIGDGDPWWWNLEELHELMLDRGLDHEFHYFEGEHDDAYWSARLPDYLRFYSGALVHR